MKKQTQLALQNYKSSDGFIHHYQKLIKEVVIPYQYEVLNDRIPGIEKSHVIANFVNAGRALRGEDVGDGFYGMVFQDSDAAKWLEAVAYSLTIFPDAELEQKADALIQIIADAQDPNGYLNTYYTIKDREKRWTNLLEGHELYCAGHMMEAAVAYASVTGKKTLLDVMEKNAEHIYQHFITEKHEGYPGHPEVELALLKLYRATGNEHCLELAKHFIDVRGVDPHYYEKEVENRDWIIWGNDPLNYEYQQSGAPVREQSDATGHSVRAVYLYTAMADLASETEDAPLLDACHRLWNSIVDKRMYVTGAIGSTGTGEAFTVDYDLPNDTAYGETCASIGLMFFASRMLEQEVDSRYSDIMERAFYNTVLAGMQLDGKKFFYVNPLEVIPGISGVAVTHKHDLPQRPTWYACACCPPNVARLISSFGSYAYGENDTTAYCHLFAEGDVSFRNGVHLTCTTAYPYDLTVTYQIKAMGDGKALAIHIPGWSRHTTIQRNGKPVSCDNRSITDDASCEIRKGYAYFTGLVEGDSIAITLDDRVSRIYASAKVAADSGCVALQRGPLLYCIEGTDNDGEILSLSLPEQTDFTVVSCPDDVLGNVMVLKGIGLRTEPIAGLYTTQRPAKRETQLTAIPYFTWGNRGLTQMRVWIPED
ncbi:MAG: glycoside hydrolase family 127 protein [Lachnospiraceae bacterium]|nr:glycoside hydrolase family 127 protein [Lachnospiraceae bacterium]